jgi:peptidyl-prolyl cis-trans isomerase D
MMRALRDKRIMHVILWMLVAVFVSFIFFSFGMRFTSSGSKVDSNLYAAQVGDGGVTRVDFNKAYQPVLDKLYASKEEGPTAEETKNLQEEVLDNLIDDVVLEQTAQKLGISVSDEELAGTIRREPYFADKNGNFDKATYYKILQDHQLTVEDYEDSERKQILLQRVRSALLDGFLYTNDEISRYKELMDRDLKAAYLAMDEAVYEKNIPATEADLKDYYEKIRSQFDHTDRVKVRHIFIPSQASSPQELEGPQKTLEGYREQVLSGKAQFGDLARKYSQDDSSKNKGGEVGWIDRGTLSKDSKALEDVLFSLKKGEISKPVELGNGYDIAQVEDTEKAYKSTFEEVRLKVTDQYKKEKASQKILSLSTDLVEKLKAKEPLEKAAGELGLKTSTTDWFNRNADIKGLKNSKGTAAELAGLYVQDWKGPLSLGEKEYFFQIIDAKDGKSGSTLTDQEKAELEQRLISQRQDDWLQDFLTAQRKTLNVKSFLNS